MPAPSPAVDWLHTHNDEPYRVVGLEQNLFPGYAAVHRLESTNGPDALINRRYRELALAARLAVPDDWYFPTTTAHLAACRPLLDLLNVRYFMGDAKSSLGWPAVERAADLDLAVFRNDHAWPRAFFTDRLAHYDNVADFLSLLTTGDGRPFAATDSLVPPAAPSLGGDLASRTVVPKRRPFVS